MNGPTLARYLNQWLGERRITPQKPRFRAREQDEVEGQRWLREEWPRIRKSRHGDRHLLTRLRGAVIVVWDGGPVHRGEAIRAVLRDDPRVSLEKLPPDTPELNPVEHLWNHLKYGVLSNFVPDDVSHLDGVVKQRLRRARLSPR